MPVYSSGMPSKVKLFTVNLNQAGSTYDLCTASGDAVFRVVGLFSGTAAGGLTSVSIQTNNTTATEILSAVEGAVAGLTGGKNIVNTFGSEKCLVLADTKKIQYTITGTGNAGTIKVFLEILYGDLA